MIHFHFACVHSYFTSSAFLQFLHKICLVFRAHKKMQTDYSICTQNKTQSYRNRCQSYLIMWEKWIRIEKFESKKLCLKWVSSVYESRNKKIFSIMNLSLIIRINNLSYTFLGSNSVASIYGNGSIPTQLEMNTAAKQIGGIQSKPGWLLQKNPYTINIV